MRCGTLSLAVACSMILVYVVSHHQTELSDLTKWHQGAHHLTHAGAAHIISIYDM